jgi:glycosyltransferase involved in cell wall biosynthesis
LARKKKPPQPKLSVATVIIVKDEEDNLKRLLDSMSPEVIGNLFVTDTGSSDDTIAVAKSYGAVVTHFPWCEDFAAARNYAAEQVPKYYDWIFMPDADEYLLPGDFSKLVGLLEKQFPDVTLALIGKYHFSEECIFGRDRCYRRGTHHWRKRVHETPEPVGPSITVTVDVDLFHAPGPGWSTRKRERDLRLLKLDFQENPKDLRNVFYLAREYYYNEPPPTAIGMLEYFLTLPGTWNVERSQAYIYMGEMYAKTGDSVKALDCYLSACREAPWRREGYYAVGMHYYNLADNGQGLWEYVLPWLEATIAVDGPANNYLSTVSLYSYSPHQMLSVALWKLGKQDEAFAQSLKAYHYRPDKDVLQRNLMWTTPGVESTRRSNINNPAYWDWSIKELAFWDTYAERDRKRFELIAKQLFGLVLDIGSGPNALTNFYPNVITVDYSSSAKPNVLASATELPFADKSCDCVVLAELLEHLENPFPVLQEARRVARKKIVVTVPYKLERDTGEHLWSFNEQGLTNVLSVVGAAQVQKYDTGVDVEQGLLGVVKV